MSIPYVCASCRRSLPNRSSGSKLSKRCYTRPSFAPKPILDLKHIRNNPGLYEQNCIDRKYAPYARNGWKILEIHERLVEQQKEVVQLRRRSNAIVKEVGRQASSSSNDEGEKSSLLEEARALKRELAEFEAIEKNAHETMEKLALELPNLSSLETPVGQEAKLLRHINEVEGRTLNKSGRSHVEIGKELDILDFEASATTSGWGWYFLKNEGALLEQALIQYALSVAMKRGWQVMTPPSLVYSHIASACGFMPRDQHGETQIYSIAQHDADSTSSDKPSHVLAGTAEIPFAGSQANRTLRGDSLPLKVIGPSRCYRAEAGARGVDTKGLYRVHEFTKVEMFAWTVPPSDEEGERFDSSDSSSDAQSDRVFEEMLAVQSEIISSLGLRARMLEMPSSDLGASATRKVDIEAFFPSRSSLAPGSAAGSAAGFGELTSASLCTDYQARRLGTRLSRRATDKLCWPHTLNGTALAVPRVLACLLETHYDDGARVLHVPLALRRFLPDAPMQISRA